MGGSRSVNGGWNGWNEKLDDTVAFTGIFLNDNVKTKFRSFDERQWRRQIYELSDFQFEPSITKISFAYERVRSIDRQYNNTCFVQSNFEIQFKNLEINNSLVKFWIKLRTILDICVINFSKSNVVPSICKIPIKLITLTYTPPENYK